MEILILGGTGAIGVPLVNILANNKNNNLYITSRSERINSGNITYLYGNAKDTSFFKEIMKKRYDAIIDFMSYSTIEFEGRIEFFLNQTTQYIFLSSSRCYADSPIPIKENSPRLVDKCYDKEYILLDEYGMAKGREENLLRKCNKKNWTIVRPYITYNNNRLQLGVYEKENWLRRLLDDQTIIFPLDMLHKKTSLTYANDVAYAISKLIGNDKAFGEDFNITTDESHTWEEILDFYSTTINRITGKMAKIKIIDNSNELMTIWNKWQIKYDRLFDREFDNSKIKQIVEEYKFTPTFEGLKDCLQVFINNPSWTSINVSFDAWCDRRCNEWTHLKKIDGYKNKVKYLKYRVLGK